MLPPRGIESRWQLLSAVALLETQATNASAQSVPAAFATPSSLKKSNSRSFKAPAMIVHLENYIWAEFATESVADGDGRAMNPELPPVDTWS
jgi:hypothetical protein